MSSYNSVNGDFADVNKVLLTDVLREEWGFDGFVSSDWVFGVHDAVRSMEAGMDVEMPMRLLRARELPKALESGRLARETVLASARRILATTLRHYAMRDEGEPPASVVAKAEHRMLARHVAARGAVLLNLWMRLSWMAYRPQTTTSTLTTTLTPIRSESTMFQTHKSSSIKTLLRLLVLQHSSHQRLQLQQPRSEVK